jgi:hypothetical protein
VLSRIATLLPLLLLAASCGGSDEETNLSAGEPTGATTADFGCQAFPGLTPPPEFATVIDCGSEGVQTGESIDFGGVEGKIGPPPTPLPPGLFAVSDYYDFQPMAEPPAIAGFAIPLTEEVDSPSTVAFYSYVNGEWQQTARVIAVRGGRAEGEFATIPQNVVVLREVR